MSRKSRPASKMILGFLLYPHASLMGRLNADSDLFIVLFFSDGIATTTQSHGTKWSPINSTKYKQLTSIYTNIDQIFYIILNKLGLKHISLTGNAYLSSYHVAKSMLPCPTDCTCLCMFSAVCS